jgi:hypothetical protein
VDVDTYTVSGRDGDLFLLCSDGLTSMIADDEVASILRSAGDLRAAADELVRAANQSGGKDNITVVMFRLGGADGMPGEDETIAGQMTATDVRSSAALDQPTDPHPGPATALADRPADSTVIAPPRERRPGEPKRRRRPRFRTILKGLLGLVVVAAVVAGLYALSRQVYFIGTNDAGLVTIYRGVPYELPLGLDLYEEEYPSGVPARAIPERRRDRVLDHEWRSREDALDLIRALERGQLSG